MGSRCHGSATGGKAGESIDPGARRPACTQGASDREAPAQTRGREELDSEGPRLTDGSRGTGGEHDPLVSLVLGGARSGKSEVAERLSARYVRGGGVAYIATGALLVGDAGASSDPEWAARVEEHRRRRPGTWQTIELGDHSRLVPTLEQLSVLVLVDSLGAWVAGAPGFDVDTGGLLRALSSRAERGLGTVLVSEEVGMGVHAPTEVGRRFTDVLGALNRDVASGASEVLLVVAGRSLRLPGEPGEVGGGASGGAK